MVYVHVMAELVHVYIHVVMATMVYIYRRKWGRSSLVMIVFDESLLNTCNASLNSIQ